MTISHFSGPLHVGGVQADDASAIVGVKRVGHALFWEDDFLYGAAGLVAIPAGASEEHGMPWSKVIVGAAPPTVGLVADGTYGEVELALTSANQAQDAVLYMTDQRNYDVGQKLIMEFRIRLTVLPTTGAVLVCGMSADHDLDKDTNATHAWFRWQASAAGLVETDDTTNDNDDVSTGLTTVVDTFGVYLIDFTDLADVQFFVDGIRVAGGTTFDMSNLTAAEKVMQPYFSLDKAVAVGVGTIKVDYVRIWSDRG